MLQPTVICSVANLPEQDDNATWGDSHTPDFDSQRVGAMAVFETFKQFLSEIQNTLGLLDRRSPAEPARGKIASRIFTMQHTTYSNTNVCR